MIPLFKVLMAPNVSEVLAPTLQSGFVAEGPRVAEFEQALARVFDAPGEILATNSCTSALDLALHLAGVVPGDEVITTAVTCTATNGVIVNRGAWCVWADVDPLTGLIDPGSVKNRISKKTKAIMAVDWAGATCDYDALKQFGVPVIEDAAHAFRARYNNKPIAQAGGDYVCWSFQAIKALTCGDGGALKVPADQETRARLLRWYGLDRRSSSSFRCAQMIEECGYKYHMNDVAASIGLANLPFACASVEASSANAKQYTDALSGLPGIRAPRYSSDSAWWLYTLLVDDRDGFMAHMKEREIETSLVHARNDKHPAFERASIFVGPLTGLGHFASHQVSIPVGWWLTESDRLHIIRSVQEWANR